MDAPKPSPSITLPRIAAVLVTAGCLSFGLAACGSDDGDPADPGTSAGQVETTGAEPTGSDKGEADAGEIKPEGKAPESAGDERGEAPDDVISERPGGPGTPEPASP